MSKVWAVKHRPTLKEIVGQDHILDSLDSMGHMIFHSREAGTGGGFLNENWKK